MLPTAAGKSKIVEEDLRGFAENKQEFKGLILVPGVNTLVDWEDRIRTSLPELKDKIEIKTYAYMARHYTDVQPDHYNYLVVDEAHHAVAPVLKELFNILILTLQLDLQRQIKDQTRKSWRRFLVHILPHCL